MDNTIRYYEDHAAEFAEGTIDADMTQLYRLFESYVLPGSRILDFGCGSGRDTKYFLSVGYRVDALDGSEALCKIASQYTGIPVKHMYFQELEEVERYDGIWACSSILHVPEKELPDIFFRLHRALKPGGYLYTSFKYGDFSGDRNGRFFTDLTERHFQDLLAKVPGLQRIETAVTGDVRPGRESEQWLNLIIQKIV